jgi:hypothetical protein
MLSARGPLRHEEKSLKGTPCSAGGHRRERARQPQNQRLSDYKTSEKAVILFSALTDLHKNDAE